MLKSWCLSAALTAAAMSQQPEADSAPAAALAGLRFLAATQQSDGSWPEPGMRAHDRLVDTALAGLALVAAGERLDGGCWHPSLRSAVRFVQDQIPETGPLRVDRPEPGDWRRFECWYAAFAALFLAEVHADTPEPALATALQRLGARLVFLQKEGGGWCHDLAPKVRDIRGLGRAEYSDDLTAVGALCLAALHAIQRAGVAVDARAGERARAWLLSLANGDGGFAYGRKHVWADAVRSEPGRTAGALWALLPTLGRDDPRADAAVRYLDRGFAGLPASEGHGGKEFLVSHLTGAWLCHGWSAAAAARHRSCFTPDLVRRQHADGRFVLGNGAWDTPTNNTAVAVLCLLGGDGLRCAAPLPARDDAAARGAEWLLRQRAVDGGVSARWGSRLVDLALTGLTARALLAEDGLGGRYSAAPSVAWLCDEIERLAAAGGVDERRSHLGFQLPQVLRALVGAADARSRTAAAAVVAMLARDQRDDGGFGYDHGELYTLCVATSGVLVALAEARDAGVDVPAGLIARAVDYLVACQGEGGGFRYCPDPSHPILARDRSRYEREEVGRTLGAVVALRSAGSAPAAVARGIAFLHQHLDAATVPADDRYLWFTLEAGSALRPAFDTALQRRWDELLGARLADLQRDDGSFVWPGMAWADALGWPAMSTPYATAAGTLLAAQRRTEVR